MKEGKRDANAKVQTGTDRDDVEADRSGDGKREIDASGLQGSRNPHAELRDECLNGEIFYSLKEAQIVIEQWRQQYNTVRPLAALGYRPPAPGAYTPVWNLVPQPQVVM